MASGGDSAAFEQLSVPLLRRLYNLARWLTRDDSEAEDLVQETYTRALKGFGSFQPGTNFAAWMFRILRNAFLASRARSHALLQSLDDEVDEEALATTAETPESILVSTTTRRQIQAALEKLPPIYREIILLSDVEEMKYREIAELLDLPVGTVMSRLSRARRALRGMLMEDRLRAER